MCQDNFKKLFLYIKFIYHLIIDQKSWKHYKNLKLFPVSHSRSRKDILYSTKEKLIKNFFNKSELINETKQTFMQDGKWI